MDLQNIINHQSVDHIAPNQTVVVTSDTISFYSYDSLIFIADHRSRDLLYLSKDYDYSTTTVKYRNAALKEYNIEVNDQDSADLTAAQLRIALDNFYKTQSN